MYIQIVFKSGRIKEYTSPKAWIEDNKFISAAGEYNIEEDKIMRISFSDTKFENFLENPSINDSWVNKITDAQIEKFVLNIMKVSGIGEIYRDDTDTHEVIVELLSKDGYRKDVIHFGLNDITSTYNYVNVYPYISRWKEYLNSLHISCENIKNKDNWIDKITDNQIIWFLKNYFDVITVECIKRNNIQIIVDVHMLYVMEAEKVSMPERLFISPYHIACNEFSESNQDGNWEKYLFSLGIHPLQLNNSFMKGK